MSEIPQLTENQLHHNVWNKTFTFPHRVWQVLSGFPPDNIEVVLVMGPEPKRLIFAYEIFPDGSMREREP